MDKYINLAESILRELCIIPAPSHCEDMRVEYLKNKLSLLGICDFYVDQAKNVVIEFPAEGTDETVIIEGHTDVVFPDTATLPFREDEEKLYCPGIGDDTVAVAMLVAEMKKLKAENKKPKTNIVIVLNSCEEGLGNLKGTKEILNKYGKKVSEFITFDGMYDYIVNKSVGSHRYQVTVKTEGGHSFNDFGNQNSANVLAMGISMIYDTKIPEPYGKTTYNVGMISGGTSVNTIIQEASMLCEYRSDNISGLQFMEQRFNAVFDEMRKYADVEVKLVGERPCAEGLSEEKQAKLDEIYAKIIEKHINKDVVFNSGSTDCNIPHSMGIPAVCLGCYQGGGAHTRDEWMYKNSIPIGFSIVSEVVENYFE